MEKKIAILAGDGIGQEIMPQALRVLNAIEDKYGHHFTLQEAYVGGAAFDRFGSHFPEETKTICKNSDAILFGSVGGPLSESHLPKWKNCEKNSILALRKVADLNANLRPVRVYPELAAISPLKERLLSAGIDILIVRELIGDIYFGEHKLWSSNNIRHASDIAEYNEQQISAVAHEVLSWPSNAGKN